MARMHPSASLPRTAPAARCAGLPSTALQSDVSKESRKGGGRLPTVAIRRHDAEENRGALWHSNVYWLSGIVAGPQRGIFRRHLENLQHRRILAHRLVKAPAGNDQQDFSSISMNLRRGAGVEANIGIFLQV